MAVMICQAVQKAEVKAVALDDQHLAEIQAQIRTATQKRAEISAGLRKLRRMEKMILDRRVLTDTSVS